MKSVENIRDVIVPWKINEKIIKIKKQVKNTISMKQKL